jgi:hypothetical protein
MMKVNVSVIVDNCYSEPFWQFCFLGHHFSSLSEADNFFIDVSISWPIKIMKRLSPKLHGILDYITVVFLLLSPSLFPMHSYATIFTYSLAFVHLALTLLTNFKLGVFRLIPFYAHGVVEIFVSIALMPVSYLFFLYDDRTSFYFYLIFAIVLLVVWLLTPYTNVSNILEDDSHSF